MKNCREHLHMTEATTLKLSFKDLVWFGFTFFSPKTKTEVLNTMLVANVGA